MKGCLSRLAGEILDIDFYIRDTSVVASELIGKILVRKYPRPVPEIITGIITETEAYYGSDDPASHAFRGITGRSGLMFGRPGIAYVYFCYGMHHMLNTVTEKKGVPGAVLIRAVKPAEGIELMINNRKVGDTSILADGPGKLAKAFGIDLKDNGKDLTDKNSCLYICRSMISHGKMNISKTGRIGLSKGKEKQLRFVMESK